MSAVCIQGPKQSSPKILGDRSSAPALLGEVWRRRLLPNYASQLSSQFSPASLNAATVACLTANGTFGVIHSSQRRKYAMGSERNQRAPLLVRSTAVLPALLLCKYVPFNCSRVQVAETHAQKRFMCVAGANP